MVLIKATRRLPVIERSPDGSMLALIGGMQRRIITAHVSVTWHGGSVYGDDYRLATALTNTRAPGRSAHPALPR